MDGITIEEAISEALSKYYECLFLLFNWFVAVVAGLNMCFGKGPVKFIKVLILPGFWIVVFLLAILLKFTPVII